MKNEVKIIPRITVITVVYNGASTLEATIQSVLDQQCDEVEYVIIDGGSSDGTIDIIKKFSDRITFWISEPDNGIYDAMNKATKIAKGDWIYFIGADDVLLCNLADLTNNFKKGTLYYGSVILKQSQIIKVNEFTRYSLVRHNVSQQAIFYPKVVFELFSFDVNYKLYADWLLNYQCLTIRDINIKQIRATIAVYNENGQSGVQKDYLFLKNQLANIRKYLGIMPYFYSLFLFFVLRKIKKIVES